MFKGPLLIVDHLKKWEKISAFPQHGRLFSRNEGGDEPHLDTKLENVIQAEANQLLQAFKNNSLNTFFEHMIKKINDELESNPSWKEGDKFKAKLMETDDVKLDIFKSYLFRLQGFVYANLIHEIGEDKQSEGRQRFKLLLSKFEEYYKENPVIRPRSHAITEGETVYIAKASIHC